MVTAARACLLLIACAGCVGTTDRAAIERAALRLAGCPDLAGGRVGLMVVDAATGEVLAESSADRGFAPASNNKLISSAVALHTLGRGHRMPTELHARGQLRDGVWHGDLVLRGYGDPTFGKGEAGQKQIEALVGSVRAHGIRSITGRVLGDGS
jgi:D-alanyl-D-alanine carboxypeptidase/D-alanyl-D-alanine-endopeptidase (penicillin-binding protein 4)